jgi:hypothetical protein
MHKIPRDIFLKQNEETGHEELKMIGRSMWTQTGSENLERKYK